MKWALALSGGGALGLAHLGVLKVLEKENLRPCAISGTSMGAIIGALWATGYSSEEMIRIALDFRISDFMEGITYKIPFGNMLIKFLQAEEAFGNMLAKRGLINSLKVRNYLNELFQGKTFQETEIPFYCNAVDLLTGHEMILHDGLLSDGVYSSMAYPGFFEPLERAEELLCDGSVLNNYPVWIARRFGCSRVIGVDVGHYSRISSSEIDNALTVMFRSFVTSCQTQRRKKIDKANLTLHLEKPGSTSFNFEDAEKIIQSGEEAAFKELRAIKRTIHAPITRRRTINI